MLMVKRNPFIPKKKKMFVPKKGWGLRKRIAFQSVVTAGGIATGVGFGYILGGTSKIVPILPPTAASVAGAISGYLAASHLATQYMKRHHLFRKHEKDILLEAIFPKKRKKRKQR